MSPLSAQGTYAPTFSFDTPGDLSVAYTQQAGVHRRIGNLIVVDGRLSFTPTYTTASGAARFGGLSAPASFGGASAASFESGGAASWPSGATQLLSPSVEGENHVIGQATGSGVNTQLSHTYFTSGTARVVNYSLSYSV
ncbi:MAG: hypothetical protein R3C27_14335 [Hyphomonadaceae bacterium]